MFSHQDLAGDTPRTGKRGPSQAVFLEPEQPEQPDPPAEPEPSPKPAPPPRDPFGT